MRQLTLDHMTSGLLTPERKLRKAHGVCGELSEGSQSVISAPERAGEARIWQERIIYHVFILPRHQASGGSAPASV